MATLDLAAKTAGGRGKKSQQTPTKGKKCPKKLLSELTTDELRIALESLPQELYDQVYVATFTAPPGVRDLTKYHTGTRFAAINLLHVSRDSRKLFAATYYGNGNSFSFRGLKFSPYADYGHEFAINEARIWLKSVPEAHRALIHEVVLTRALKGKTGEDETELLAARDFWQTRYHVSQEEDVIATKVFVCHTGGPDQFGYRPVGFFRSGRLDYAIGEFAWWAFWVD